MENINKVSVIIPARKERYLNKTIEEIKTKFRGDYEIIVTLDGADSERIEGVKYIYNKKSKGMRTAINQAVEIAEGKYLMKLDAHCKLDEGIDEVLKADHQLNWVQIPTRKRLNAKTWEIETGKPDIDYMFFATKDFIGVKWDTKNRDEELKKKLLDDTETFQGSCYFIEKDYFKKLGLLDDVNFNGSGNEAAEISLKVWHNGGRIIRNKKTWYAHARMPRYYVTDRSKSRKHIRIIAKNYGYKKS